MYLSNNLINYISKFLNVIELSNFERYLESPLEKSIFTHEPDIKFPKIKHIKKFYSDLSPELFNEKFYNALTYSKAFISGSSVLQAIIGEKWDDFDIDIYQPCEQHCCGSEDSYYFSPIENYLWKKCVQDKYSYNNYPHILSIGIHSIRRYKFKLSRLLITSILGKPGTHFQVVEKDLIIQVINVEYKVNLYKFVVDKFDFKFCMNSFDGKKLYIKDSKSITKKESKIMVIEKEFITEVRCQKYQSRGFKIIGYDLSEPVELDVDSRSFYTYSNKIIYPKTVIVYENLKSIEELDYIFKVSRKNKNIELVFKLKE